MSPFSEFAYQVSQIVLTYALVFLIGVYVGKGIYVDKKGGKE